MECAEKKTSHFKPTIQNFCLESFFAKLHWIFTVNLDDFEEAEVEDGDDEEGKAEHGHKVGGEDVVAYVRWVNS